MNYLPHFNGKVQEIRAMGYDFLGSLLELTDNSARKNIQSKNISVILHKDDDNRLSRVSVIDDGLGMNMNSLCTAFIFNLLKEREEGDIGKFHVGMKYAAIVIGSDITILSKSPGSPVVGLWANIETMKALDTFTPTEVCDDVSDSWALRHVHPADYAKFKGSSSGTIISITNMTPMCRAVYSKVSDELKKSLPNSYVSLYNGCLLHLYSNEELLLTVKPNNLFYVGEEELLDEPAYSTVLSVYRDSLGNERLIEMNTESRFMANGSKKKTVGSVQKPVYYEFTHYTTDKGFLRTMMAEVDARLLPDASTLIDTLKMRIIQVKDSVFKSERALFTDLSKLQADRKGFYFNREIRMVGAGKQLGTKFGDRTSMAAERQRCLIDFSSSSDSLVGSKYNKQMSEHALPCLLLNDALLSIWKQVTNPWVKAHPGLKQVALSDDESENESDLVKLLGIREVSKPDSGRQNPKEEQVQMQVQEEQAQAQENQVQVQEEEGEDQEEKVDLVITDSISEPVTSVVSSTLIPKKSFPLVNEEEYSIDCNDNVIVVFVNGQMKYTIDSLNCADQLYSWLQSEKKHSVDTFNKLVLTVLVPLS